MLIGIEFAALVTFGFLLTQAVCETAITAKQKVAESLQECVFNVRSSSGLVSNKSAPQLPAKHNLECDQSLNIRIFDKIGLHPY